ENDFGETLASLTEQGAREGVVVTDVVEDHTPPRMVFDPSHPDANADGYVAYPNVDPMTETIDLMAATRAYEANVQVVNATRRMAEAALGIGGGEGERSWMSRASAPGRLRRPTHPPAARAERRARRRSVR